MKTLITSILTAMTFSAVSAQTNPANPEPGTMATIPLEKRTPIDPESRTKVTETPVLPTANESATDNVVEKRSTSPSAETVYSVQGDKKATTKKVVKKKKSTKAK